MEVGADTADISRSIREAVPGSNVKISTVNGRIRVGGTVADQQAMQKVLDIVDQYGSPAIINTMTLVGGQQVNLEVRILEAQRDAPAANWALPGRAPSAVAHRRPAAATPVRPAPLPR